MNQAQYQGSAKAKGFAPVDNGSAIPALTNELNRQQQGLIAANQFNLRQMDRYERVADTNAAIERQYGVENLKSLAAFSKTASDLLVQETERKNERDMQEGLSLAYMDGIDPAEQMAFDIAEDHLKTTDDGIQKIGDAAQASGQDFLGVHKLRELSGWKAYGYAQGIAAKAPAAYANFLAQIESQIDPEIPVAEKAAILAQKRQEFFSQTGMLGINPALLNKYAFPGMREADSVQLNRWRQAETARVQDGYIAEAQEVLGADPVGNTQKAMDLLVRSGKFTRTSARDAIFKMAPDIDTFDAMAGQTSWDGKTTWMDKYPLQMKQLRREMIRQENQDYETDKSELALEGKRWADQVIEEWEQNPPSAEQIVEFQRKMDDDFGYIDPRLERWTSRSTDAEAASYYKDYFDKMDRAGRLTVAELNDPSVPSSVRDSYLAKAQQQEKARTEAPEFKAYEKELEEGLKRVAKQQGLEPSAAGLELATAAAKSDFNRYFMDAIKGGASASEAAQAAFAKVNQEILKGEQGVGKFRFDARNASFPGVIPTATASSWSAHTKAIAQAIKTNKVAALDRNALIPQATLEDAIKNSNNPGYQIPPIAQYISDLFGGTVSPWEVLNRQAAARGLGELPVNPRFQQVTQGMTPAMTRLLSYKPSYNRVGRAYASTGTFDPNRIPRGYGNVVLQAAQKYGIDPAILAGVIETESNFTNHQSANQAGAVGIAQIVPKWHPTVDPTNANASIMYAAKYLSELRQQLGSMDEAIYAYNSGPGLIRQSAENRAYHPKVMKAAAKYGFNPTGNPWSNPAILNPKLVYVTGNIGPTSTGPHLDVKRADGGHFLPTALDKYVDVADPEYGRVPLSRVGISDGQAQHRARGSHGIDYRTASGSKVYLKGGAKLVGSVKTEHGDKVTIRLPNGQQYTFLHGRRA